MERNPGGMTVARAQALLNREFLYREYESVTLMVGKNEVVWEPKYRNIQSADLEQEIRRLMALHKGDPPVCLLCWESRIDPDNPDSQTETERDLIQDPILAKWFYDSL